MTCEREVLKFGRMGQKSNRIIRQKYMKKSMLWTIKEILFQFYFFFSFLKEPKTHEKTKNTLIIFKGTFKEGLTVNKKPIASSFLLENGQRQNRY